MQPSSPRMVVKKVVPVVPVVPPRSISSWCFKPLFLWMRILGIELDPLSNPYRQITYNYGLLMLLLCQWASISLTSNYFKLSLSIPNMPPKNSNTSKSATYDWNVRIDIINNFSLMSIVCPAFFYIAHSQRWLRLLDVMKKFDFAYCQRNRGNKIGRYSVFVGFVPILSEIGIMIYNVKNQTNFPHASVYQMYLVSFAIFAKVMPISALVLFGSLVWQSAAFYEEIQQDVERKLKLKKENIGKWKCILSLVDELVDRINECFGLILLVSITHFFVEFIARSFYLVSSVLRNQLEIIDIVTMTSRIFLLWYFVCCPAKLHNNAVQVAISLRKIDYVDINLKNEVSFLTTDIIQNLPRISALGYFEVDAQLIPKLIGTTLTYLVILCQFQRSENND